MFRIFQFPKESPRRCRQAATASNKADPQPPAIQQPAAGQFRGKNRVHDGRPIDPQNHEPRHQNIIDDEAQGKR